MKAERRFSGSTVLVAIGAAGLLAGCDAGDRATVDSGLTKAVEAIAEATDSAAGRIVGREYSNTELLGFINAMNDAEIEMGEMARPKATDAEVRAFAQRIVADHRALKTEVATTAQGLTLTPSAPDDDDDLREDHEEGMRDLRARAQGKEFDEAFVEHEIRMHRKALGQIEDALEDNRNSEIRPLLEKARSGIRAHLQTAEELEKKFGTA
jgi:putative membrane protein